MYISDKTKPSKSWAKLDAKNRVSNPDTLLKPESPDVLEDRS